MRLRPEVTIAECPDGAVLLDGSSGGYWQLNPTGAAVLRGLLGKSDPKRVARELAETYGISHEQADADVDALRRRLLESKLVSQ